MCVVVDNVVGPSQAFFRVDHPYEWWLLVGMEAEKQKLMIIFDLCYCKMVLKIMGSSAAVSCYCFKTTTARMHM